MPKLVMTAAGCRVPEQSGHVHTCVLRKKSMDKAQRADCLQKVTLPFFKPTTYTLPSPHFSSFLQPCFSFPILFHS